MRKLTLFLLFMVGNIHLCAMENSEVNNDEIILPHKDPCISLSLRGLLKGHSGWVTRLPTAKEDEQLSSEEAHDQFLNEIPLQKKFQVKYLQFYLLIDEESRGRSVNIGRSKKNRNSRSPSPKLEKRSPSPRRSGMENSGY